MPPTEPPEPTEDLTALAPRKTVDRYDLGDELGSGAMGTVWRAFDTRLGRNVAVKEVHLPADMPPRERARARARMVREAQAAARVSHPSVVTVHDVLEVGGVPYIVMELLDGESLRERIHRAGPLPEHEVERMARPLLGALWAAHRAGVIHRDVKPANIMLAEGGARPVLTDFGIANLTDSGATSLTGTGTILGTAAYAAPERLDQDETTAISDLWSLGATLFAALAGESPFKRETLTSTLTAVLTLPVPDPPARGRLVPLISGLLQRDPRGRLAPDRALALLSAAPSEPGPSGAQGGRPMSSARRFALWTTATALVVLVAAALTVRILLPGQEEDAVPPASPAEGGTGSEEEAEGSGAEAGEDVPDGFVWVDDDAMGLAVPEDWGVADTTDEYEGSASTRLAGYEFETGVATGTAEATATDYEVLVRGAEDSMLRLEEILIDDEDYADVERLRLDTGATPEGWESTVFEAVFQHEEREHPERWMLVREVSDASSGVSYRVTFNFPLDQREEHLEDFERVLDSLDPVSED